MPDDLIVVVAVRLADQGGAHHQVLVVVVVGHAVGIASGERGGEVEVIRTQTVLIPAPVYGGCVMASVAAMRPNNDMRKMDARLDVIPIAGEWFDMRGPGQVRSNRRVPILRYFRHTE